MSKFDDIFSAAKQQSTEQQPVEQQPTEQQPTEQEKPVEQKKPMAATPDSRRKKAINWDDLIEAKETTKRLNLDIPESTDKRLGSRAKQLKITKAALVRRLIDAYLEGTE